MSAARCLAGAAMLALLAACGGGERPTTEPANAPATAVATPSPDDLLDWAGWAYPELLAYPGLTQAVQLDSGPAQARRHVGPAGDRWLGVDAQGGVWGLGDFTADTLRLLGQASDWARRVQADRCQVYPLATGCGIEPVERRLGFGVVEGLATLGPERRLVAWGRTRGTGAVDLGVQARWLVHSDGGDPVMAVGTDGQLSSWTCNWQFVPNSSVRYCVASDRMATLSAGRVVQAEALHWQAVSLREDGSLWLHSPLNAQPAAERLHGLPRMRQLARSTWSTELHNVLAIGLDGRVWQIDLFGSLAYARELTGLPPVRSAACSFTNCLVLATDGTVWVWGFNDQGQLGNGQVLDEMQLTPRPVAGLQDMVDVAMQHKALYAVGRDGRVWTWGGNDSSHPMPTRGRTPRPRPVVVEGITDAAEITTKVDLVLVRRKDGSVWGWGDNVQGLLDPRPGSDTYFAKPVPVAVPGLDLR